MSSVTASDWLNDPAVSVAVAENHKGGPVVGHPKKFGRAPDASYSMFLCLRNVLTSLGSFQPDFQSTPGTLW